jgi:hypothetical protein
MTLNSYSQTSDRSRLLRFLVPKDALTVLAILAALIAALGFSLNSPSKRIDALDVRLSRVEQRFDTIAEQQRFTNYMLCVMTRKNDPASVPPGCPPSGPNSRP